jgi:ketosteroid isomerase-like protein
VPSERLDIALRGIEAYNRGDFQALMELIDDDVEAVVPDGMANAGTYRGVQGFQRMTRHWGEAWAEFRVEVEELIEEGDAVIAPVTQHARGRGSGVETQMSAVHLMRFRRGRMYRWRLCETLEEAERHAHTP